MSTSKEQTFNILPHPAVCHSLPHQCDIADFDVQKSNDPRDLEGPQLGAGLNSNPEQQAFHARGPYKPSQQVLQGVEEPKVSAPRTSISMAES